MKRLSIIGVTMLALFALGISVTPVASAEEGLLPLTKKGMTVLSGESVLETHNKEAIKCKKLTGTASFTNDSKGSGSLTIEGCTALGFTALSLSTATKETINIKGSFAVCLINSAKLEFGVAITPSETVHIEAPALGILLEIKGTFIGQILTIRGKLFVADFNGKEGLGNVASCGTEKNSLLVRKDPEAFLEASKKIAGALVQFEEEVELMDT